MDQLIEVMDTAADVMNAHVDGMLRRGAIDADDVVQFRANFDAFSAATRDVLREVISCN